MPGERGPVRGLARLLRRNPTEAERMLWEALTKDRRFAGQGFKRQVPVGVHITDFVSFPLRVVIDVCRRRAGGGRAAARASETRTCGAGDASKACRDRSAHVGAASKVMAGDSGAVTLRNRVLDE